MRRPDRVETYQLGHWEAGQIALALDHYADYLAQNGHTHEPCVRHTRDLAGVFGSGEATFVVLKSYPQD